MVGKIKRVRQKLHHGAVRVEAESCSSHRLEQAPLHLQLQENQREPQPAAQREPQPAAQREPQPAAQREPQPAAQREPQPAAQREPQPAALSSQHLQQGFNFPKGVFAGTKITPEALVQTLKVDEPSPVRTTKPATEEQKGREEKKQQSKKEKMKERRQRWLNKISAIKVAREQQVALERRKATPVVGDMRVLADALPELTQLLPSVRASTASSQRKQKGPVKKKAEPTDYYQMKPAQKRKLLETEMSQFSDRMKDPTFKVNPLAAIGEHLRKRLRQEDEQS